MNSQMISQKTNSTRGIRGFGKKIVKRFQRTQVTAADRAEGISRGRRSEAKQDLILDKDARLCNITDARRLSRCHYEDLLRMQAGARLVLYMKLNTKSTNLCVTLLPEPFEGKSWTVAMAQRVAGVAGDVTTIAGKKIHISQSYHFKCPLSPRRSYRRHLTHSDSKNVSGERRIHATT